MGRTILIALAALSPATMRDAAGAAGATVVYAFDWSGIEVARLEVDLATNDAAYLARWKGETTELVGTLFPFTAQGAAEGRVEGGSLQPRVYRGRSEWRDGGSVWQVEFDADGRASEVRVAEQDPQARDPVPAELRIGPDPATLALSAINRAEPGLRMEGRSFDGRRAVDLALACDNGPALDRDTAELSCSVSGRVLAGASRQWRQASSGEAEHPPVRVWLRRGVHGHRFWPVRIEASSRFGTIYGRLLSIRPSSSDG